MFFRIFLSVITVFLIVVYMNMDTHENPILLPSKTLLSPKIEVVQVFPQQEVVLSTKDECKSYIMTDAGKICVLPSTHTENNKNVRDNVILQDEVGFGDVSNLQPSLNNSNNDAVVQTQDFRRIVRPSVAEMLSFSSKIEEPEIEPRAVLINPF